MLLLDQLKGIGPNIKRKLARLNITSTQDLLLHRPLRYEDRTRITPIRALQAEQEALVQGTIQYIQTATQHNGPATCVITDATGCLTLKFFHFHAWHLEKLKPGVCLRCYGRVRQFLHNIEMTHPHFEVVKEDTPLPTHLTPVYPTTEGISQTRLKQLVDQALIYAKHCLIDFLPQDIHHHYQLMSLAQAIQTLHHPDKMAELMPCIKRLALDELIAHLGSILLLKNAQSSSQTFPITLPEPISQSFLQALPFQLTQAQTRAWQEIQEDLQQPKPMLRLLQGDVGSGKTVIAALACLAGAASGFQTAVMAPTEILARQHYENFSHWLRQTGFNISLLTGSLTDKEKKQCLERIACQQTHIVIGTHALFQDKVQFKQLGLAVIDEQHRFGVSQRLALQNKGDKPHQLIITATPIPRSLAMTFYGELSVSELNELPKGRKPIKTAVMPDIRRQALMDKVYQACLQGQQVYWVCPLIEESELLQCQAAEQIQAELKNHMDAKAGNPIQIGLIHGRMKEEDKQHTMQLFKAGGILLLVATTVIEVGVDVPNANLMIIENAERVGLAQLHQLRGRIGRGSQQGYCILLYQPPVSETSLKRLGIIRDSCDGFFIAQQDLEIRGPGEWLGTRQSGDLQFIVADLQRDQDLVGIARQIVDELYQRDQAALHRLVEQWLKKSIEFARV